MSVKTTVSAITYTPQHIAQATSNGQSLQGLHTLFLESCAETILKANQLIAQTTTVQVTCGASFLSTATTITMASRLPASVVPGMVVFDNTSNQSIGTVASGAGTTTLTLSGQAGHASSGSADVLTISDPNLATLQGIVTTLS